MSKLICPWCGNETKVIDSRYVESKQVTRRRRECNHMNTPHRFTTYEILDGDYANYCKMTDFLEKMHIFLDQLENELIESS